MMILIFILGLCFGSFANVLIYRLPLNKSIVFPSSFCPRCNKSINWYDKIPILSFIILKGKCRNCFQKISFRYPIIEFLTGIIFLLIFLKFENAPIIFIFYAFFSLILIVIAVIDFESMIIPDSLSISLMILGLLFAFFNSSEHINLLSRLLLSIIGGISGFVLLYLLGFFSEKILKKESLGGGDIKMAAGLGFFFGLKILLIVIFLSSILATIFGIFFIVFDMIRTRKKIMDYKQNCYIPYGPFLSLVAIIALFVF